jgi:hypothetical protein
MRAVGMKVPRRPMPDHRFTACRARAHAAEAVAGDRACDLRRAAALVRLLERALAPWERPGDEGPNEGERAALVR